MYLLATIPKNILKNKSKNECPLLNCLFCPQYYLSSKYYNHQIILIIDKQIGVSKKGLYKWNLLHN